MYIGAGGEARRRPARRGRDPAHVEAAVSRQSPEPLSWHPRHPSPRAAAPRATSRGGGRVRPRVDGDRRRAFGRAPRHHRSPAGRHRAPGCRGRRAAGDGRSSASPATGFNRPASSGDRGRPRDRRRGESRASSGGSFPRTPGTTMAPGRI
jgi:hypothetical protein